MEDDVYAAKYAGWTTEMMKKDLRRRGARVGGRKAELLDRMISYDKNKNFGLEEVVDLTSSYKIGIPVMEKYKDLNTSAKIPRLTAAAANLYLFPFDKVLGSQNKLWLSRFMVYIRWAEYGENTFIRGNCRAEMRKSVTYNVDIVIDKHANIRQTQCECAAGIGPNAHCKHVLCLVFSLVQFFSTGKLNTELTCTEKLQTFHKAKKFTGSPKKMANIHFGNGSRPKSSSINGDNVENVNGSAGSLRYDPRNPSSTKKTGFKENYNEFFKSLVINFSSVATDMPFMQLVEPANPYAFILDHDYCEEGEIERLLKYLKVTKIDTQECYNLETSTRQQAKSELWRQERLNRLTSSNFGRICKATDKTDRNLLAKSYTIENKLNTAAIKHGRTYESLAICEYQKVTGHTVNKCGIFVNSMCPFICSSPDGVVSNNLLVEVKCPYVARDKLVTPVNVPYLKEEHGQLTLCNNHDYFYQIQGQLFCAQRELCDFIVYTKTDMKIIRIKKNEPFISKMLQQLTLFFDSHFKAALLNKYIYRDYYSYDFWKKHKVARKDQIQVLRYITV